MGRLRDTQGHHAEPSSYLNAYKLRWCLYIHSKQHWPGSKRKGCDQN